MCFHPEVSLRAESDRESMVPEQATHEGILRLHHRLTSTEHSSWVEERYDCELRASVPELYVCISGGICSRTGTGGEDQILQVCKLQLTQENWYKRLKYTRGIKV